MPEKEDWVTYPRDVPDHGGLLAGWRAREHAYGEKRKTFGQTYIRFDSKDGRRTADESMRGVYMKNAGDQGPDPHESSRT